MTEYLWLELGILNGKTIAIEFAPAGLERTHYEYAGDPGTTRKLPEDIYTLWIDDDGVDIDQQVYELLRKLKTD